MTANGVFTAPPIRPSPPSVTLTARSVADPAKTGAAAIQITSNFTLTVGGPLNVTVGTTAQYTAMLIPVPNSNPSRDVGWSVTGSGCSGAACGTISNTGSYNAPATPPSPNNVVITATPAADPAKATSLTVVISVASNVTVQLTPASATRAVNHRQTFSVQVAGTSNQTVQWQVNGKPGGDTTVGLICVANANPCQPVTTTSSGSVDYLAPAVVPPANPVAIQAVSQADPSKSASAQVTILAHILVSVSPPSVTLAPRSVQQFVATVVGTPNQGVVWQIAGSGCGGAGSPCGLIDPLGFYSAPLAPPTPNTLSVVATSSEDTSRSGSSAVTIATGPAIIALLPASASAGAAGGFTLLVEGANFVRSTPGPGSMILLNSSARSTICTGSNECSTTLSATDLSTAASLPVQVRNPDLMASNQVSFVVVPDNTSEEVIPLTPGAPSATGKDIIVVEPSTAGTSSDLNLNIVAIGFFSVANNTCVLANSPLTLSRAATGSVNFEICAFSLSGLDPALSYTLTGPSPNDVAIIGKQPLGLGIIHLTLQVPSTAVAGARTLFVTNANKDKTAVSGGLEIK